MAKTKLKVSFINGISEELKRVSWPSRKETVRLTVIVVAVSLIVALYISIIDVFLAKGLGMITRFK